MKVTENPMEGRSVEASPELRRAGRRMGIYAAVLTILFSVPLVRLATLALKEDLYSHVLLMPFIAGYLVWMTRSRLPSAISQSRIGTVLLGALGMLALAGLGIAGMRGELLAINDSLAFSIGAFVLFLIAGIFHFLGTGVARVMSYPICLLFFLIPFPTPVRTGLEVALQHSSAEVAYWFMQLARLPVLRDGVVFSLPGITIQVAEECSGIRSSFVLFITGLIGGFLFLENWRHRLFFTLVTVPLGIVRNGFRVLVLSLLCVHIDPSMIHSAIHHRGGPVFFVLSLIPLFALLHYLRLKESREKDPAGGKQMRSTNQSNVRA